MYVNCRTWNMNLLSCGISFCSIYGQRMCLSALTSVLSRSSTCGFFSSICRSMFASGEIASYPVTVRLGSSSIMDLCPSTESCTVMCSVTADRFETFYSATMPNSLFTAIKRLLSPASLLDYLWPLEPSCKGRMTQPLAMRMLFVSL